MDAIIEQPYRHTVCAKSYMYVAVVFGTHCIAGKSLATSTAANIVTFTMYRYCVVSLARTQLPLLQVLCLVASRQPVTMAI